MKGLSKGDSVKRQQQTPDYHLQHQEIQLLTGSLLTKHVTAIRRFMGETDKAET